MPPPDVLILSPEPTSAAQARRFVGARTDTPELDDIRHTVELLVSELVTNAVLHAATEVTVRCSVEGAEVLVEVSDRSTDSPTARTSRSSATTGRGLDLVEQMATDWGVEPTSDGKTVWFRAAPA